MTRTLRMLSLAAMAALAGMQLSACASSENSRGTGEFVSDAALTARVKSALAVDAGAETAANVDVTTYRGVVQLSGFVDSERDAQQAVAVARKVDGVQSVENALRVAPSR